MIYIPDLYNITDTDYESTNIAFRVVLFLLIPIKYIIGLLLSVYFFCWAFSGFGFMFIIYGADPLSVSFMIINTIIVLGYAYDVIILRRVRD